MWHPHLVWNGVVPPPPSSELRGEDPLDELPGLADTPASAGPGATAARGRSGGRGRR